MLFHFNTWRHKWPAVCAVLLVWPVLLDMCHALWIALRYRRWDRKIKRDAFGVRSSFQPIRCGDGSAAILFVHGFGSRPLAFRHYLDHFSGNGYHCSAIRLSGFGETADSASRVRSQDWINAVVQEAENLRASHGSVWIIAHSLGAAIVLRALQQRPGLADGLVLAAPLIGVSRSRSPFCSPLRWLTIASRACIFTHMLESVFPIDVSDPVVAMEEERDVFIPLRMYSVIADTIRGLSTVPVDGNIPILMLLASEDHVTDSDMARQWLASAHQGVHDIYEVPAPSRHLLMLDTGWEQGVSVVDTFIRNHSCLPAG